MTEPTMDTDQQLDALDRTLKTDEHGETVSATLGLSQVYATDIDDLWDACTSTERLARWFAPVSGELRVGGRFLVQDNAGGTVESCDPPHGFTTTWEFGGETSRIEVRLTAESPERTRMTLTHSGEIDSARWSEFGPGAMGVGWELGFAGLGHYQSTGASTPLEASEWLHTADAKRFITESSRRWAEQARAAGMPDDAAQAAHERTAAFYTGTEMN
ncbi:SRPBCC family protein [Nocardia altamirensis]|uniref:SRPBCC family protein n=1 Tax=Nocardia altamirensis TaxID=472158 RepID=UPI00084023FA|nr:SRPBCC family protein [Nocardia altamirensis]